jgi:hypothetical protein
MSVREMQADANFAFSICYDDCWCVGRWPSDGAGDYLALCLTCAYPNLKRPARCPALGEPSSTSEHTAHCDARRLLDADQRDNGHLRVTKVRFLGSRHYRI